MPKACAAYAQAITIAAPLYDIAMTLSEAARALLAAFAGRCTGQRAAMPQRWRPGAAALC